RVERLKFITDRLTVPVWLTPPLVPAMFSKYEPAGVELEVVTVNVELPGPVTEGGLKLKPVFAGIPLTLSATVLVKLPIAPMVTLKLVEPPLRSVCEAGAVTIAKSASP